MMMNTSKSLQELEDDDWGLGTQEDTGLVQKCLALRRVPLEKLNAENCRMLVGQNIGSRFIVPLALRFLDKNPFEGGDTMAPGAILGNLVPIPIGKLLG